MSAGATVDRPAAMSNRRRDVEPTDARFLLAQAGVDSFSLAFRPESWEEVMPILNGRALWQVPADNAEQDEPRSNVLYRGRRGTLVAEDPIRCSRMIVWPRRLIAFEGRLAAVLNDDLDDARLLQPSKLDNASMLLALAGEQWGLPLAATDSSADVPIYVRRLDLAADVRFDDPADGRRFLEVLAKMRPPEVQKTVSWRGTAGNVETVTCMLVTRTRREVVARIYDRGVAAEAARRGSGEPAGSLVRIERQLRWDKRTAVAVDEAEGPARTAFAPLVDWARRASRRQRQSVLPVVSAAAAALETSCADH